ncbi:D-sedoheptulose-7-phosphate isomerase [Hutsoniella sourekii]
MTYIDLIDKRIEVFENLKNTKNKQFDKFEKIILETIKKGNKIFTIGNGGSAANAQHITGDIIGRYKIEREGWPAISLTVDPSVVTALANDYGYERVFSNQIVGLGREGDLLIVLSSSAKSKNLIDAAKTANNMNITTIGILGNSGGDLASILDENIIFEFSDSDLVEEVSMAIFHMILSFVEEKLVKEGFKNAN